MSAVEPNQIKFNQANSCNTRPPSGLQNQICIQNAVKTLPKALRTQALTALTSNFGLVGMVIGQVGMVK